MPMPGLAGALEILDDDGRRLAELPLGGDGTWCLHWQHSVTGGDVRDCFATRDGRMVLARSYLHDAAAGLGHLPGRGTQRSAPQGGYWIEGIDEPIPDDTLRLRVGGARVDHRLTAAGAVVALSRIAADRQVRLRLSRQAEP